MFSFIFFFFSLFVSDKNNRFEIRFDFQNNFIDFVVVEIKFQATGEINDGFGSPFWSPLRHFPGNVLQRGNQRNDRIDLALLRSTFCFFSGNCLTETRKRKNLFREQFYLPHPPYRISLNRSTQKFAIQLLIMFCIRESCGPFPFLKSCRKLLSST